MHGYIGDHQAAGMYRQVVGELSQLIAKVHDLFLIPVHRGAAFTAFQAIFHFHAPDEVVYFMLGQPVHLAQLPRHCPELESAMGAQQGRIFIAVLIKYIAGNVLPVFPGEVQVEIGRGVPMHIQEALKVEVQLYRVHIGDTQAIGSYAIGPAASAHSKIALAMGIAHNIPGGKEVGHKVL